MTIGTWTAAGELGVVGRQHRAAIAFEDGRVLVCGGRTQSGPSNGVELWDPASSAWSVGPAMNDARAGHTCTLLRGGRVLVLGGFGREGTLLASAEVWKAGEGSWQRLQELPTGGRTAHACVALPDGGALVVGGATAAHFGTTLRLSPELTWTPSGEMRTRREEPAVVGLTDGTVLAVGGREKDRCVASAERWDPARGVWKPALSLEIPRRMAHALALCDDKVLVAGGIGEDGQYVQEAELLDLSRGEVRRAGAFTTKVTRAAMVRLTAGAVLAVGGGDVFYGGKKGGHLWRLDDRSWQPTSPMSIGRLDPVLLALPGDGALAISGNAGATPTAERFWVRAQTTP